MPTELPRPRVVHIITRLIVGGAQLTALGVCEATADRFETHLVSGVETGSEGSLRERAEQTVPVHYVEALRRSIDPVVDARAVRSLSALLGALAPDIVHTHSSKAGVVGRIAARGTGAKVVHTVHGWGHTPTDSALRRAALVRVERALARSTDALVAVSDDVRSEGVRLGIGRASQYAVIPELVELTPREEDFAAARARATELLGLSGPAGPTIGWVGRFVPQKDPEMLARAMALVLTDRADARAVLVGDGRGRDVVEAILGTDGLRGRVTFAGLRSDARELYPAMDLVLHTSRWEGQPRVVQEALAERVPVVATRVSGVQQLVRDGVTGFVVEPGDVAAMAQRALTILNDPDLRAPLSPGAVEALGEVAGVRRSLDGHYELYDRLLGAP